MSERPWDQGRWEQDRPHVVEVANAVGEIVKLSDLHFHTTRISIYRHGKKVADCERPKLPREGCKKTYLQFYPLGRSESRMQACGRQLKDREIGSYQEKSRRLRINIESPSEMKREQIRKSVEDAIA